MFTSRYFKQVVVALTGVLLMGSAHAELKVATVDFQRLMTESVQAKAFDKVMQDEFSPRQRDLMQRQKELQSKEEKLNRDGAVMAEKERTQLEKDLVKGKRDFQADGEAFSEELNSRRQEEGGKMQAYVIAEAKTWAKNNGYDFVVPAHVVVFAKESLDVTSQVLTYLQGRPANVPAAPAAKPAK